MNRVTLIGNLGRDPEQRFTPSGDAVTTFSMAMSEYWTAADGQRREKTVWVRITCWRKLAENASQYLHKGSKVCVEGKLEEPNVYLDKEGKPRASLEVTANTLEFLTPKGEQGMDPREPGSADRVQQGMLDDDSIPF
jgi:single-strand DNA-binding protein